MLHTSFYNYLIRAKYFRGRKIKTYWDIRVEQVKFKDKPWVHAHLLEIQKKVGKEKFLLIEQAFYPNDKDMVCENYLLYLKKEILQL